MILEKELSVAVQRVNLVAVTLSLTRLTFDSENYAAKRSRKSAFDAFNRVLSRKIKLLSNFYISSYGNCSL